MLIRIDCLDRLIGMHAGDRGNDDGLQAIVTEHLIVRFIKGHAKWL